MADSPRVSIQAGTIKGCTQDHVRCFLGIPYAKPPVGERRFLPPMPCESFFGVYDASFFRDSPMQFAGGGAMTSAYRQDQRNQPPLTYSEDCLYLNVWAPKDNDGAPLPVLFWIYGGAYCMGSSSLDMTNGASLAKKGVIVVSINYRVGIFGFLAHPSLDKYAPYGTNAGLWDLVAGLRWVKENIAAFGGDPNNVTIQGESAGSAAVNTLLLCSQTKGLFHRAITQSFSPFNHDEWVHDIKDMQQRCVSYLSSIGITSDEQLFRAPAQMLLGEPSRYFAVGFSPYVDGVLLPEHLEQAFLNGHFHDVPVLLGCTADEATTLIGDPQKVTEEAVMVTLKQKYPDNVNVLIDAYKSLLAQSPAAGLARFRSDNTLANMRFYASVLCAYKNTPTYFYLFSRVIPGIDAEFFRAYHAGEISYAFGNLHFIDRPFTQDDEKLSQTMMAYWTSFADSADPNSPGLPHWDAYARETDLCMHLDAVCRCGGISNRAHIDFLQQLLWERTGKNNPDCKMPY